MKIWIFYDMKPKTGAALAEQMLTRPEGATMGELIAATGGPQYNVLKRLEARGHAVRRVKEGRETRYFVTPPERPVTEIAVSPKGQLTLPKALRERLGLTHGGTLRLAMEDNGRTYVAAPRAKRSILELVPLFPSHGRHLPLEEIDDVVAEAAIERALRR